MLERLPVLDRNDMGGVGDVRDDLHSEAAVERARVREDVEQRTRPVLEVVGRKVQLEEGCDRHAGDASTRTMLNPHQIDVAETRCPLQSGVFPPVMSSFAIADNILFVFPPPDPLSPDVHPSNNL